ncbi:STAS domain-containing protein [Streptomyces vinaceus]|uniref:STAS domain-containing protein n=1 Tax=Streptomyces vinaceus TaxID=1960 RepID=UPI0038211E95
MNSQDPYTIHVHRCTPERRCEAEAVCVRDDGHAVVCLKGEFDADTVHVVREVLAATDDALLIVDLSGVTFADASLLHALLDARRRLVLAGPLPDQFHRLLDLTGTGSLFAMTSRAGVAGDLCGG